MAAVLVDADVLIEVLRGATEEVSRVDAAAGGDPRHLSVLTVAELRAGASGDAPAVASLLGDFRILPVDLETAERGGRIRREYGHSHGTDLVDAILAATALEHDMTLITNNRRHFPMPELALA